MKPRPGYATNGKELLISLMWTLLVVVIVYGPLFLTVWLL